MSTHTKFEPKQSIELLLRQGIGSDSRFCRIKAKISHWFNFLRFVFSIKVGYFNKNLNNRINKLKTFNLSNLQLTNVNKNIKQFLHPDKEIIYKKNGILVIRDANNKKQMQFIRIATISKPVKPEFDYHNNESRIKMENKFNKLQDLSNEIPTIQKERDKHIEAAREKIAIRYPDTHSDYNSWIKDWYEKRRTNEICDSLENLIQQGVEVQLVVYKRKFEYFQSLVILIEYGPLYTFDDDKSIALNRSSALDFYKPIKNYKKFIHIDSNHKINLLKYRSKAHPQFMTLTEEIISKLLYQSTIKQNKSSNASAEILLSSLGKLSDEPNNCILGIPNRDIAEPYPSINKFTKLKYLNLNENKSLYVEASNQDFEQFILNYEYLRQDNHILMIFSNKSWIHFDKIYFDQLRLSLISLQSDKNTMEFVRMYMAIDMMFGDSTETGTSDLIKFIEAIVEYDARILKPITTIDGFLELLTKQLTNQAYMGKTSIISNIYQIIRQYNLRQLMDPEDDSSSRIGDIDKSIHFKTDHSSADSLLSMLLILFKFNQIREINGLAEITLVIDDPRIIRILSEKKNFAYFTKFTSGLQGIRIIFHSSSPIQYSEYSSIPKLVINKQGERNRKSSTLHFGTEILDVNTIQEEVYA